MKTFKNFLAEAKHIKKPELLWFATSDTMKLNIPEFNLPAGSSCPSAGICKAKGLDVLKTIYSGVANDAYETPEERLFLNKRKGKYDIDQKRKYTPKEVDNIIENVQWTLDEVKNIQYFVCYAMQNENQYPGTRAMRKHNMELLENCGSVKEIAKLIYDSIMDDPKVNIAKRIRLHSAGDFFSDMYMDAWIKVAEKMKDVTFYGYTKSVKMLAESIDQFPSNLRIVASYGGKEDKYIEQEGLVYALVVDSPKMAHDIDLPIDIDDSLAVRCDRPFAMLLHGMHEGSFLYNLIKLNDEWKANKKKEAITYDVDFDDEPIPKKSVDKSKMIDVDEMLESISDMIYESYFEE